MTSLLSLHGNLGQGDLGVAVEKGVGDSHQQPSSSKLATTWPGNMARRLPATVETCQSGAAGAKGEESQNQTGHRTLQSFLLLLLLLGWRLSGKEGLPCKEQEQRGTGRCSCPLGLCLRQSREKQAPERPGAAAEHVFREPAPCLSPWPPGEES